MKAAWLGRRLLIRCAAVAAVAAASPPPAATAQVVPPDAAAGQPPARVPAPAAPKLRWDRVCALSLADGRIALKCDLTVDVLRALDGKPMAVDGLAGTTTLTIVPRRYAAQNQQRAGDADLTLLVSSVRGTLTLNMLQTTGRRTLDVQLTQSGGDYGRRIGGRSADCQLTVLDPGAAGDGRVSVGAADFATLRAEHPHEVNRYLRPLFRRLGADLLRVEPAAARQVLFVTGGDGGEGPVPQLAGATRPAADDARPAAAGTVPPPDGGPPADAAPAWDDRVAVAATVRATLADLDAPAFARRQAAADRLAALGPPALAALAEVDRGRLSAQQALELDLLAAAVRTLQPDEARQLRSDVHFLFDCLYTPDPAVRAAAARRLGELTRARPEKFARALAAGEAKDAEAQGAAVEDLREELAPKRK